MRDRNAQYLAFLIAAGERRVGALDADVDVFTDELQIAITQQSARQKSGFAQNLESVTDAQNDTALAGKIPDGLHDRREARDRARPQVISVREAAGQNDRIVAVYLLFFMPDEVHGLADDFADHVICVVIAIGAG